MVRQSAREPGGRIEARSRQEHVTIVEERELEGRVPESGIHGGAAGYQGVYRERGTLHLDFPDQRMHIVGYPRSL